ncbi:MAG: hypothetical protein JSR21_17715 [Proteobacteria bacterium]|nr:hypothetical protein [Pseudomonadota bacterium]
MTYETRLTADERAELRAIAAEIVPASDEYGVPGADDPAIQADLLATLGRDTALVREALGQLRTLAGGSFGALPPDRREVVAGALRATGGKAVATLSRVVLQCYYRDDRVLHSLGLEARAPFPMGNVLPDGDWSLLDPVRARPPFWRRTD